ncbi:MAG: DMT family transporter [Acetobacteraceae bacterium]|nr:DMT family transporter [Acetobacteraceae bacterium]
MQVSIGPAGPAVAWRLLLAGAILQAWLRGTGRHRGFAWRDLPFVAAQGLGLFAINNLVFYEAVTFIASGLVAVIVAMVIPLNALGLRFAFGTPISGRVILGAALAAGGLALVFAPEWGMLSQAGAWRGVALGVAGSFVVASANMAAVRNARARLPTLAAIGDGLVIAGVFAAAVSLARGQGLAVPADARWIGALLFQALLVSILSFFCYFTLQMRIGADRAAYVLVVVPVLSLALSSVVEDYRWSVLAVLGAGLVAAGNAVALMPKRR